MCGVTAGESTSRCQPVSVNTTAETRRLWWCTSHLRRHVRPSTERQCWVCSTGAHHRPTCQFALRHLVSATVPELFNALLSVSLGLLQCLVDCCGPYIAQCYRFFCLLNHFEHICTEVYSIVTSLLQFRRDLKMALFQSSYSSP